MLTRSNIFGIPAFMEPQVFIDPRYKENQSMISLKILENVRERPISGTPLSFIQIYSRCWNTTPSNRPTAIQVLLQLHSLSLEPTYNGSIGSDHWTVNLASHSSSDREIDSDNVSFVTSNDSKEAINNSSDNKNDSFPNRQTFSQIPCHDQNNHYPSPSSPISQQEKDHNIPFMPNNSFNNSPQNLPYSQWNHPPQNWSNQNQRSFHSRSLTSPNLPVNPLDLPESSYGFTKNPLPSLNRVTKFPQKSPAHPSETLKQDYQLLSSQQGYPPPQNRFRASTLPLPHSNVRRVVRRSHKSVDYSGMIPCSELCENYIKDNQDSSNFVGSEQCDAGIHVGIGDVIGLQFHLDSGGSARRNYDYNYTSEPLIHIASAYCEGKVLIKMLETLKAYEADFKATNKDQKTALHRLFNNIELKMATDKDKVIDNVKYTIETIEMLCKNACPINALDKHGRTVLSYYLAANPEGKQPVIQALLELGANPNLPCTVKTIYQTFHAPTALFLVIHYNWPIEAIKLLLEKGADARIWDEEKNINILCLATKERKPEVMKWLLEHVYCLSELRSIKMARQSKILLAWQADIGGSKRKLARINNLENYSSSPEISFSRRGNGRTATN
ncbi:5302_t:CDS:2 [Acaulospora colombiana]|uniref:5302_t:CDS:1 n=1 Tax=Acaulospora colombiana TaxID=27376 RepID=A0ACA9KF44_9GLOM|nr:5302_t:CDS:2 [Acaulospora colombiana]